MNRDACKQSGFTLVELVVAMVVLAAATTGVLLIFANATTASADPQIRAQARSIAAAYMDEILLQAYEDPDGTEVAGGGTESGEDRADYDDVWDYKAIGSEPPADMFDNPISGLRAYTVAVTIDGTHPGDPAGVQVRVQHASGQVDYVLHGERHGY